MGLLRRFAIVAMGSERLWPRQDKSKQGVTLRISLLILALTMSAQALSADKPAQPAAGEDKLICKREVPIGSLIASRKRCMTKAQWERMAEDQQYETEKMVEKNRGLIGGN